MALSNNNIIPILIDTLPDAQPITGSEKFIVSQNGRTCKVTAAVLAAYFAGGGTVDAYTKDETDDLLDEKADLIHGHVITDIAGLQDALDLKANDNEVVKSVNGVSPDSSGNVAISVGTGGIGVFDPVQDLAALKAIDTTNATTWKDKWTILVEDLAQFYLDRDSTATPDDVNVVQPTVGVGRWLRVNYIPGLTKDASGENTLDYTPSDSDNVDGFFKTLLTLGKLKFKSALDRIVSTIGLLGNLPTVDKTSIVNAIIELATTVTDKVNAAFVNAQDEIYLAKALRIGDLFNDTTFANFATNYTVVGTPGNSIVSNKLRLNGGAANYSNYIYRNWKTVLERYEQVIRFRVNSSAGQVGLGIITANEGIAAYVDVSAGANRGKVFLDRLVGTTATNLFTGSNAITFANGDLLEFKLVRERRQISCFIRKIDVDSVTVLDQQVGNYTFTYNTGDPLISRTGNICLISRGCNIDVEQFIYRTDEYSRPQAAFKGDSIVEGYAAGDKDNRYANKVGAESKEIIYNLAYGGLLSSDLVNGKPEDLKVKPKFMFVCPGVNDARAGVAQSVFQANVEAYCSWLSSNGTTPIIVTPIPQANSTHSALIDTYITGLNTLTSKYQVIDINTPLKSSGVLNSVYDAGDGIHLNSLGHDVVFDTIVNSATANTGRYLFYQKNYKRRVVNTDALDTDTRVNLSQGTSAAKEFALQVATTLLRIISYGPNHSATDFQGKTAFLNGQNGMMWIVSGVGKALDVLVGGSSYTSNRVMSFVTAGLEFTLGKGLRIKEGTNARQGVATLVGGTVTISNNTVTASTRIFLTAQDLNTSGNLRYTKVVGTSFTITSTVNTDTGVVAYFMTEGT